MRHSRRALLGATAVVSIVAMAGTALAVPTQVETKCHQAIAKFIGKYQSTLAKNLASCNKTRSAAPGPGPDCNTATGADTKGRRDSTRSSIAESIASACPAGAAPAGADAVLARYVSCPSPASSANGGNGTIDSFDELSTCLLDLSEAYVNQIGEEVLGSPDILPLSKPRQTCQGAVAKALSKFIKTVQKTRAGCQKSLEKEGGELDYPVACTTGVGDPKSKIASSLASLNAAFSTSCLPVLASRADYQAMDFCAQRYTFPSTNRQLACAVAKVANPVANGLAAAAEELTGTCAGVADVLINARAGEKLTRTRLDYGWKGTAHNSDVVDQSLGAVTLSGCDLDCTNCAVLENNQFGNCRCEADATIECNNIEAGDPLCPGSGTCHCMLAPPQALNASATPVCVVNRLAQQFTGGTGEVGEYNVAMRTKALVHLGISQVKPCPTCDGDPAPNDGIKGGTCDGGPNDSDACDENADNASFGPVSWDCPPDAGANISGPGLNLSLQFSSGTQFLPGAFSSAGAFCDGSVGSCHCSVCASDTTVGCSTNADCVAAGAGTVCGLAVSPNPQQNNCDVSVFECVPDGSGSGSCNSGPFDLYCDGFLTPENDGIVACANDAECDANDCDGDGLVAPADPDPHECGLCALEGQRRCFLPTISATGTPGIFNSEGVSVYCAGKTGNGGVDQSSGLPGPGRIKLDLDFDLYCADGTTPYQLPGGSNCP